MFCKILKFVVLLIIIDDTLTQIQYPERLDIDKKKTNLNGRLPLFAPTQCKHDELLYPGDQQNDWICDCAPGAIYHPDSDACYPAFRQGPCREGQLLVLRSGKFIPECIRNSCRVDGQIRIHRKCYTFGQIPPCRNGELSYVLGVDPETLLVDCVRLSLAPATHPSNFEDVKNSKSSTNSKAHPKSNG